MGAPRRGLAWRNVPFHNTTLKAATAAERQTMFKLFSLRWSASKDLARGKVQDKSENRPQEVRKERCKEEDSHRKTRSGLNSTLVERNKRSGKEGNNPHAYTYRHNTTALPPVRVHDVAREAAARCRSPKCASCVRSFFVCHLVFLVLICANVCVCV